MTGEFLGLPGPVFQMLSQSRTPVAIFAMFVQTNVVPVVYPPSDVLTQFGIKKYDADT